MSLRPWSLIKRQLITKGLCIVSWKNMKTEDYLVLMVVVFLVFPSLSEIAHRGKDGTE